MFSVNCQRNECVFYILCCCWTEQIRTFKVGSWHTESCSLIYYFFFECASLSFAQSVCCMFSGHWSTEKKLLKYFWWNTWFGEVFSPSFVSVMQNNDKIVFTNMSRAVVTKCALCSLCVRCTPAWCIVELHSEFLHIFMRKGKTKNGYKCGYCESYLQSLYIVFAIGRMHELFVHIYFIII